MTLTCYKNFKPVKAIGFDLDDTLYDNAPVLHRAEQELHRHLASHFPRTKGMTYHDWFKIRSQVVNNEPALSNDIGLARIKSLTSGLIALGYDKNVATQGALAAMAFFLEWRNTIEISERIHQTLATLAKHYRLFAISNGNASTAKLNLDQYFEFTLHANIDTPMKPAATLFELAQARLALSKQQILYIGDHPVSDIIGANNAGWQTGWFNPSQQPINHRKNSLQLPTIELSQLSDLTQLC